MKSTRVIALALSLASVMYLTACDDNNRGNSGVGGGGSTANGAPAGFGARTMNVTVNDGSAPFATSGSYVLTTTGTAGDTSGNYTISGSGSVPSTSGTYTYQRTATNSATLVLMDNNFGNVTDTLTFDNSNSGSIQSALGNGAFQSGTFTLQ